MTKLNFDWIAALHRHRCALNLEHQRLVAVGLVMGTAMLLVGIYWYAGGAAGRLDFDDAPRQKMNFQVDVNRAQYHELVAIPGIGETLAKRMVAYRNQHGPFQSLQELKRVAGVGDALVARIAPYITAEDAGEDPGLRDR